MPLPADCTLFVRIWTGQRCLSCASPFQYLRRFKVMRRDTDYTDTVETIEASYAGHCRDTAAVFPCPHCGWVQPDMIATKKAVYHGTAAFIAVLVMLVNLFALGLGIMPPLIGCSLSVAIAGVLLLFHLYYCFNNLNAYPATNLQRAKQQEEADILRLVTPAEENPTAILPPALRGEGRVGGASAPTLLAIALAFSALLCMTAPMLFGWPLLPSHLPGIVLTIAAGSAFANLALRLKSQALPQEIVEINSTLILDESVPADFQKNRRN